MRFAGNIPWRLHETHRDFPPPSVLPGQEDLLRALAPAAGSRIVEFSSGASTMVELWGARLHGIEALELVQMRPTVCRRQADSNVRVVAADAASYRAPWLADYVYFSYALTRIPDWVRALNNALALLKPGGKLGVVDFYVAGAGESYSGARHGGLACWLWMHWFALGGVHLSAGHLRALFALTDRPKLREGIGPSSEVPLLKAPYYVFTGVKPDPLRAAAMSEIWKQSAQKK